MRPLYIVWININTGTTLSMKYLPGDFASDGDSLVFPVLQEYVQDSQYYS